MRQLVADGVGEPIGGGATLRAEPLAGGRHLGGQRRHPRIEGGEAFVGRLQQGQARRRLAGPGQHVVDAFAVAAGEAG